MGAVTMGAAPVGAAEAAMLFTRSTKSIAPSGAPTKASATPVGAAPVGAAEAAMLFLQSMKSIAPASAPTKASAAPVGAVAMGAAPVRAAEAAMLFLQSTKSIAPAGAPTKERATLREQSLWERPSGSCGSGGSRDAFPSNRRRASRLPALPQKRARPLWERRDVPTSPAPSRGRRGSRGQRRPNAPRAAR